MIQSFFIISQPNDICFQKHWTPPKTKAALELFLDHISKSSCHSKIAPFLQTNREVLIHVYKNKLFYLAICVNEVNPLLIIQIISCFIDVIISYFGNASEQTVKENSVYLYEILDEMLDNGFPVTTEPNALMEMIKPGSILKLITDAVTGKSSQLNAELPVCHLSNVRWRRTGIKYTNNEIYFDVIEHLNAIIDPSGNVSFKEVCGNIECFSKLSGTPDLVVTFIHGHVIDDASLHPCIRFMRWQNERILSFVPPDGKFCLLKYRVSSQNLPVLPINIRPRFVFEEQSGSFDLVVSTRPSNGSKMDSLKLSMKMPRCATNVVAVQNVGRVRFDPVTKVFDWEIGHVDPKHSNLSIKGTITLSRDTCSTVHNPPISVEFTIHQYIPSGLKIARLDMYRESYKLFKGVRYITKAGLVEIRT